MELRVILKQIKNVRMHKRYLVLLRHSEGVTIEWNCGVELSNDTFYIAGINSEETLLEM